MPRCVPYSDGKCEKHHLGRQSFTSHEKIMIEGSLAGKPITAIAKEVGLNPATVAKKLSHPRMREIAEIASRKTGVTTEKALLAVGRALEAQKILLGRDRETGEPIPVVVGPDHETQLKAADTFFRFGPGMAPTRIEQDPQTVHQTLVILPAKSDIPLGTKVKVLDVKTKEKL